MPETDSCCKVGRVAEKYSISPGVSEESLDEQVTKRWLGSDEYPEMSLRNLLDWFHKHLLRTAYTEHGRSTLEPHLESDYRALQNEGSDEYYAVLSDLESDGIDGDQLVTDFVSTATLYRHLTGCLQVQKDDATRNNTYSDRKKLEYVENMAEMYLSDLLSVWENRGEVPRASEADFAIRIYLECPACSKQTNIRTVKQQGYVCEEHMLAESVDDETDSTRA